MSLFSGMRLTMGKKPAQSISAQVQDGSVMSGKHVDIDNSEKTTSGPSVSAHQSFGTVQTAGGNNGTKGDKVSTSERASESGTQIDVSATKSETYLLGTHAMYSDTTLPNDLTLSVPQDAKVDTADVQVADAIGTKVSGTNVQDEKDVVPNIGTTNVQDDREVPPSPRIQRGSGSMFSFISSQSDEFSVQDGNISCNKGLPDETKKSHQSLTLESDVCSFSDGNINSKVSRSSDSADDATVTTSGAGRCEESLKDISTVLDFELDPFSVDKPTADGRTHPQSSKLSFDLAGLVLSSGSSQSTDLMTTSGDNAVKIHVSEDVGLRTVVVEKDALLEPSVEAIHPDNDDGMEDGYQPVIFEDHSNFDAIPPMDPGKDERPTIGRHVEPQYDVELSFKDRLEVLQQMHMAKLTHFSEALAEITSQISSATSECIQSSSNLLEKQQTLKRIQSQRNVAVTQEDYAQAELLNEECETLEATLQKMPSSATVPSNHPVILDLINVVAKLHQEEANCMEEQLKDFDEMRKLQESTVEEVKGQYAKMEASEKCQLDERQNTLQRDIGHLSLDKEHLKRKESQLEKRIDEKTSDVRKHRDELCAQRQVVQEEIVELEKKLASLRHHEMELSQEISQQDDTISEAKEEFKAELEALDKERSEVKDKDVDVTRRQDELRQMEERIMSRLEKGKMDVSSESSLFDLITHEIQTLQNKISDLHQLTTASESSSVSTVFESEQDYQQLYSLQEQLKSHNASVQTLTAQVLQDQTKLVSLRQKVSDTEGHIATLTDAKKMAVSGRNFAEAKRLANEIKDLTSEGQKSQGELEETMQMREKNNYKLETLRDDIDKMKTELMEEELQYDSDLKSRLLDHIEQTQTRTSEKSTNLSSISQAITTADITVCVSLIQYLCIKHGNPVPGCLQEYINECQLKREEEDENALERVGFQTDPTKADAASVEVIELRSKIEDLESQLQAAVDEEDYDAAQLLQEQIENLQKR